MALPNRPSIEIPLLLELERSGGRVRKPADFPAFYERIEKHFPDITPEDKELLRKDGLTRVWWNSIDWARNSLHTKGELNGGQSGVWEITQAGRQRLQRELREMRVADVGNFVASGRAIPQEVGSRWQPPPLRQRTRVSRAVREPVSRQPASPVVEQPITPEVGAAPEPSPPPGPDLHQRLLARLQSLSPAQFEHLVGEFLKAKGLVVLRSRGGPGDEGVDGECENSFLKLKVAFQAKRYAPGNNVGIEPVQRLRGSMSSGFDRGVFITTSSFTPAARGWVEETRAPITLVDGNELVTGMVEMGLGMRTIPVVETQIDEDFFKNLGI